MQQQNSEKVDKCTYRFLVVDDSVFARKSISKVIESIGGEVVGEASNGREAVEKFLKLSPDLVLMDISMPEMEGLEALSIIKSHDDNANVVIVSALGHEKLVKKGISLGARHYITKPYKMENIVSVIKYVLDREVEK